MTQSRRIRLIHVCQQIFFWLTSAIILCLFVFYQFVSDRTALGEWITIWPSFFWAFGLIPLAMLSWDRKYWRKSIALFGAIIIFLVATVEWRSLIRRPDSSLAKEFARLRSEIPKAGRPIALRIATWNINSASGGDKVILDKLAVFEPDLCFLQETPDGSQSFNQSDLTGYWSGFSWRDEGDCGLLSRYPITPVKSRRIGPWSQPQVAQIEPTSGTAVLVVNVRLMLPSLVLNPLTRDGRRTLISDHKARLEQFRALGDFIHSMTVDRENDRAILAGDFNTPGSMASLAPLRTGLSDCWKLRGRGWGATMTSQFPVARIDQCWTTSNVRVVDVRVIEGNPSDHRLLIVDLLINP